MLTSTSPGPGFATGISLYSNRATDLLDDLCPLFLGNVGSHFAWFVKIGVWTLFRAAVVLELLRYRLLQ